MPSLSLLAALTLFAATLPAQDKVQAMTATGQRANAVLILADMTSGFHPHALVSITYGVPEWKEEYANEADEKTKGTIFRLGKDTWAIYDSSTAVKFGNVTVPAGIYYLGIARSKDGATWTLAFLDPQKTKAAGAWPFAPEAAPRAFEVPLTHEKTEGKIVEKLSVTMASDKANPAHGTLTIAWGDRKLTGGFDVVVDTKSKAKDAAGEKDNKEKDKEKEKSKK
jgi:hypothetical protein